MREQDPRVPLEVEQYLIDRSARAGQLGGSIGGALGGAGAGAFGGSRGGARGAASGAARLKTVVEDRRVSGVLPAATVLERIAAAKPKMKRLPADHGVRVAVPLGITGLSHVVVDVSPSAEPGGGLLLRAYGKEGVINRKPTARVADEIAELLAT